MNDITNTVDTLQRSRHLKPAKPLPLSPTRARSPHKDAAIMANPPQLRKEDSSISTLSRAQYTQRLRQKRSRLDMLDQHLSSFPLAPPPPNDTEKVTEVLRSPDINAFECTSSPANSHILSEIDPIVLVEDYIATKSAHKKLSVSDLKASLKTFDSTTTTGEENYLSRAKSILETHAEYKVKKRLSQEMVRQVSDASSLLLTNTVSNNYAFQELESSKSTAFFSAKTTQTESLELAQFDFPHVGKSSYAGSLHSITSLTSSLPTLKLSDEYDVTPTAEFITRDTRLKSCVICETPLYDISSHCGDAEYSEFVCYKCTEKYEMLSKLLDSFDEAVSFLHSIPEDVEDIEEALAQPSVKRQKNDVFSKTLLDGLKRQLNGGQLQSVMDRQSAVWLLEAKKKLRWRWRISGLIPQFLKE